MMLRGATKLERQLDQINRSLKASFSHLRQDLTIIAEAVQALSQRMDEQQATMKQMQGEITDLKHPIPVSRKLESHWQQVPHSSVAKHRTSPANRTLGRNRSAEAPRCPSPPQNMPNSLSPLHLQLLGRLMILQIESGKRAVSMRELAADMYPAKEYRYIKSTMSQYVKALHREGLVEKISRGKLYLSCTEKALQFADSDRLQRIRSVISRPV